MVSKAYGTVSPEQRYAMSGLEFVQGLASGRLPLNTIARTLGYDIVEAESGRVVITTHPTEAHLNPWGTVHGGLTATILDSCMGLAIQSTLDRGFGSTTLEFKISLVRAITPTTGPIKAEGKVIDSSDDNIKAGLYPIWSYEHMYTNGPPTGLAQTFLTYMLAPEFQRNVLPQVKGFIPVIDMKVQRDHD